MNWPGVARWFALGLGVLLVVLIATSEVVWKRGWWVFTTELVLPAFVGVAGTAVAAAAWRSSQRATEIAQSALDAETNRAHAAAEATQLLDRREQAKRFDLWMGKTVKAAMSDPDEHGSTSGEGLALRGEFHLHPGAEILADLVGAGWRACDQLSTDFHAASDTGRKRIGDDLYQLQYELRWMLASWIRDPDAARAELIEFLAAHPPVESVDEEHE